MAEMLSYGFMQRAFLAVIGAGILCSVLSFFVVLNRLSFMGAGLSHAMLGGLAIGVIWGVNPLYTGGIFAVLAASVAGYLSRRGLVESETLIGVLFSSGMALGVALISLREGYHPELFSLLFGNVLAVSPGDLWFLGLVGLAVLGFVGLFFKELLLITFDEEMALASGLPATWLYVGLLAALALTVVASVMVLGVVLASALLVIPAASTRPLGLNYRYMLAGAVVLGLSSGGVGLALSFRIAVPSGASIVLSSTLAFGLCFLAGEMIRRRRSGGGETDARL